MEDGPLQELSTGNSGGSHRSDLSIGAALDSGVQSAAGYSDATGQVRQKENAVTVNIYLF